MTDDQQFILGCLTLILPTIASVLAYRKTASTHDAVNGMQVRKVREARAAGSRAGIAIERKREDKRSIAESPTTEA